MGVVHDGGSCLLWLLVMVEASMVNVSELGLLFFQACGDYYKGVWRSFECCGVGGLNMIQIKVDVKCPLGYDMRFKHEIGTRMLITCLCLLWALVYMYACMEEKLVCTEAK